ncbi:helix-turn-helix transcriptional regulator [Chloroflexia bacterium SDU3-3]|nr:helix-turn-helix transcriptional regulator [Chloroflexia bacterium SDU3-3]
METKQQQPDIFQSECHSRQVLRLIADQWTMLVFYALGDGAMRFSQLLRRIDGISKKMLTQTLRAMERDGLIRRVVHPVVPPMVEYSLTPLGESLLGPIQAICEWAYGHLGEVAKAQAAYDQQDHTPLQDTVAALVRER